IGGDLSADPVWTGAVICADAIGTFCSKPKNRTTNTVLRTAALTNRAYFTEFICILLDQSRVCWLEEKSEFKFRQGDKLQLPCMSAKLLVIIQQQLGKHMKLGGYRQALQ
ncbi:MAG: hypothetical protein U0X20_33615, partial [Caldilineaceae bacterium]